MDTRRRIAPERVHRLRRRIAPRARPCHHRIAQGRVPSPMQDERACSPNEIMALAQAAGWQSAALPTAGALVGYLILIFANPAHRFFRDGLRCVQRHPRMWIWLSVLGLAYALFQDLAGLSIGRSATLTGKLARLAGLQASRLARTTAGHAWLPALELLAGLFNQAVVSYPTSAAAALLFTIELEGIPNAVSACRKKPLGAMVDRRLSWVGPVRLGGLLQADIFALDLLA